MQTVAIIGSGFSGTMIAAHLLRDSTSTPLKVVLIERSGRFGRGIAYGTTCASHVLNVPAGRMSAFEDDPDHFLRYVRERDASLQGGSFLPRMIFGEYLESVLEQAQEAADSGPKRILERVSHEAIAVEPSAGRGVVHLAGGQRIAASKVVLAIGNFPPADPPLKDRSALASPLYIRDPWDIARYDAIDLAQPVLLVGTGLTMVDVVLELAARGQSGPIIAVSRRGLLPQPHRSPAKVHHPEPPADLAQWEPTAKGLLRRLRAEIDRCATIGVDWREVVTSLRHDTPRLWQMLNLVEKDRFLRHLRAYWETHRHRAAPQAWTAIEGMQRTGRLRVQAGRLVEMQATEAGFNVGILPRGGQDLEHVFCGAVINCTGPDTDLSRVRDPLLVSLRDRGLIRTDPLRLGLDADEDGGLINSRGIPSSWLFGIGPLRRPQLWETTAVPELRIQAAALARTLRDEPVLA